MAAKGIVDDAEYFFGTHVGSGKKTDSSVTCMVGDMLATSKIDALELSCEILHTFYSGACF